MITAALAGLGLGLSLIIAIGAQNSYVLRQGIRREHVLLVAGICAVSDLVLIGLGIGGAGVVFDRVPALIEIVRWAGAAFLVGYGLLALQRALRPAALIIADSRSTGTTRAAAAATTTIALTWLNPHVYLDTVVLLGSVAASYGSSRWAFGAGAGVASILWFTALALGARLLAPVFARSAAWRVLDALIAVTMIGLAIGLLLR